MHDERLAHVESVEGSGRNADWSLGKQASSSARPAPNQFVAAPSSIPDNCQSITPTMLTLIELDQHQIDTVVQTVPGGAQNVQDIYPLSPLQEGMLFHSLFNQHRDTYVLSMLFELKSLAHVDDLSSALQRVIDRHDILRTAMQWEQLPQPVQVVYRHAVLPVQSLVLDPNRSSIEQLKERMKPGMKPMDLRQAPLARLHVTADSSTWYALLQLHHLVCDHQSLELIAAETIALLQHREQDLPPPVAYRGYVARTLANFRAEEAERFFRGKLAQVDEPTAPFGLFDVHGDAGRIDEASRSIDPAVAQKVRAQARRLGSSAARMFHAAWGLVVARTSGRDDVVFGTVLLASDEKASPGQRSLGMAVNTLPLRLQLQGVSAEDLVKHTHRELVQLLEFQHTPLTVAQRCGGVQGTAPLFSALLNYRHDAAVGAQADGKTGARVIGRGEAWTNYPVNLFVDDLGEGFVLTAQTDRHIDPSRLIGYAEAAVKSLAEALEAAPATPALDLAVLPPSERQLLFHSFNATQTPFPEAALIHQLFEKQVESTPAAVAVVHEGQSLTYAQLNHKANQLARYLRSKAVGPDDLVAICLERGIEMVISLLGVLKAGAAYVPLDPDHPTERLWYMLNNTAPRVVLTQERLKTRVPQTAAGVMALDSTWTDVDQWVGDNVDLRASECTPKSLAYVIHTSGSTGNPKGVMVEHRGVVNFLTSMQQQPGIGATDCLLAVTTVSFDIAALEIFLPLVSGAKVVLAGRAASADAQLLAAMLEEFDVTVMQATPATWRLLLSAGWEGRPNLKVLCGGEALNTDLSAELVRRTDSLWNLYGPTETTIWSCIRPIRVVGEFGAVEPIGAPIANTQVYILDGRLQPVPIGVAGEIYIGGAGVARGYLNRPELTAERFISNPFSGEPQARMYKTGDIARWRADGTIEYLGRNDHQVKIRGYRIELGEIEVQLARQEQLKEAVVIAREDMPGEKRLVAYVVPRDPVSAPPTVEALRLYLRDILPDHMVPSAFVTLERLPLTPNGKLDRRALPSPDFGAYASRQYEAPEGEVEEVVAGIWQGLLGVDRIGRRDNFFELGGHSLLIVQMMARLHRAGLSAEARRVFESSTLADLADALTPVEEVAVPANLIAPGCEAITPAMLPLVELESRDIDRIVQSVPGGVCNVQDIYPLAPSQEGILFHHLLTEGGGDTYVVPTLLTVSSSERLERLITALQAVIDRHDVLRTSILWEHLPRPVQVVYRQATLQVSDLPLTPGLSREEQIEEWLKPEHQKLDLRNAPLMRLQVVADPNSDQWYVMFQLHHIIGDNTSQEIIIAEAAGHFEGHPHVLPAPRPYRNYVAQVQAYTRRYDPEAFFRGKFSDVDEPTAPFGLLNVYAAGARFEEARQPVESALARRVRTQARRLAVSSATIFHAAWGLVVVRTSGRDDVVFGTVLLGRLHGDAVAQTTPGMFINTLPMRLQVRDLSARELVELTQRQLIDLLSHEQASLALAQRCSGIVGTAPLFSALLNYRHVVANRERQWASASGVGVLVSHDRTNYPITVSVDDSEDGFTIVALTDRSIDPKRVADYLHTALQALVDALENSPQSQAGSLSVVPRMEWNDLIERFNATQAPYSSDALIHELFEEQVLRTPGAVAVVYEEQALTYAELNAKANQLARYLQAKGVEPDQLVGICVDRSLEMVIGLLAILKAGGGYVPLDPNYPVDRLRFMLEDAAPRVLLTQERFRKQFSGSSAQVMALDSDWQEVAAHLTDNVDSRERGLRPEHLAYVIYTSGSTGRPKGAMNEHRAVVNRLQWMQRQYELGASDRVLQKTPFSFDVSVWEFFWPLLSGACLIVARPQGHQDPEYLIRIIETTGVTTLHFVPSMLQVFLQQHQAGQCASVQRIVCSGEELSVALQNRCLAALPNARLSNLYGPTEAAVDVTSWECRRDEQESRVPIGHPIANVRMYVLDRFQQPVPIGVAGEIYIGGAAVGRGYLNRADLTAERFVPDPFSTDPQARLYKTGDLGRWRSDAAIEYLGRIDHQVKVRGFRIELGEIESQLTRLGQVKEAAVVAREDTPGDKRLVAYLVPTDAAPAPSVDRLRAVLHAELPEYMVPSAFVVLDHMPLTPNGKLDRRALPAPDLGAYGSRMYEAPQGEVEEILAGIWQGLLGVKRVGRRDNFFELGGHSLLIVQMLERLRRIGLSADVRRVFESRSLADLACVLTSAVVHQVEVPRNLIPSDCETITPEMLPLVELEADHIERIVCSVPGGASNVQDIYPLAPLQEGILFHHLLDAQRGDTYVLPTVLAVSSRRRLEELVAALQSVIDRHDVLRTAILWEGLPRPVQVVLRRAMLPVDVVVLDPARDAREQVNEWLMPERQRLDLRQAPVMSLTVAEDERSKQWYALLHLHHITIDHVTVEIVTSEVVAYLEGRAQALPAPVPYRSHVAQALAYAGRSDAEAFFRSKLQHIDEPTAPFGILNVHGDGAQTEVARDELDIGLSQRVRTQARRFSVSAATLFHAAWSLVVAHTSGRDDVVFGSILLGRLLGNAGTERILGMFINTLPLRLRLRNVTAKELIEQAQKELVELLSHEQASLALAQRCSGVGGSGPLFTALLNYRHSVPNPEAEWSSASGIRMLVTQERTNYPITLSVDDLGEGFTLTALTDRSIDPQRVTGYLHEALLSLVDALEHSPQAPALTLSILPQGEREKVTELFNATQAAYPREKLIHQLFEEQVRRTPDSVAVLHNGWSLTYAELNGKANQLARSLRRRGAGPNELVGLCVERGLEMVVGLLGILKSGAAYVPLDPNYPVERLQHMLQESAPRVLLTQQELRTVVPDTQAETIDLRDELDALTGEPVENLSTIETGLDSGNLVYVIYTSGSTGRPKGTAMRHRSMVNLISWHRQNLPCHVGQRVLQFAALSFDVAFQEMFSTLCTGGTLVLLDESVRRDPRTLMELLTSQAIERVFVPPLMLQSLAEYSRAAGPVPMGLRDVITAGEQLRVSPEIVDLFKRLNGCRLHNHYGPTETHVVTAATLTGRPEDWPAFPTIGRPIANSQIYVLDDRRQAVPLGAIGEIFIGGANVACGYLNQPELTAARFLHDPFSVDPQARMYKTGDLGRWLTDGTVEYLGRNDHQVKIRGYRIELGEIEAQLTLHEQIKEAAVVAREDVPGAKRLVAYVTRRDQTDPTVEQLRTHLASVLPDYMLPSAFVILACLPLMPSGKLDRRALPAPEISAYAGEEYEPPEGEIEEILAGMWQELLQVDRVGRNDNFFDLGGHSLLAMQVFARVQSTLSIEIPMRVLFVSPTVKQLAAQISELRRAHLLDRIADGDSRIEELLEHVASLPESKVQELLGTLAAGGRS